MENEVYHINDKRGVVEHIFDAHIEDGFNDPRDIITVEEGIKLLEKVLSQDVDGNYTVMTTKGFKHFVDAIRNLCIDDTLKRLVDDGLVSMSWDAEKEEFVFSITEEGKKAAEEMGA